MPSPSPTTSADAGAIEVAAHPATLYPVILTMSTTTAGVPTPMCLTTLTTAAEVTIRRRVLLVWSCREKTWRATQTTDGSSIEPFVTSLQFTLSREVTQSKKTSLFIQRCDKASGAKNKQNTHKQTHTHVLSVELYSTTCRVAENSGEQLRGNQFSLAIMICTYIAVEREL